MLEVPLSVAVAVLVPVFVASVFLLVLVSLPVAVLAVSSLLFTVVEVALFTLAGESVGATMLVEVSFFASVRLDDVVGTITTAAEWEVAAGAAVLVDSMANWLE